MNLTSSAWNINPVLLSFNVPWSVECFETISKDVNSSSTVSGSNCGDATFIESKHDILRKTSKLIVPMPLFESEIQIVALLCSPPISLQIFSTSSISPFPLWDLLLNSLLLSFEHFTSNNLHQIKSLKASTIGNFPPFTCTKCHQHFGQLLNLSLSLCSKMSVCQVFPCHLRPTSCSWSHKSSPYLHWTLTGIRFNVTACKEKKKLDAICQKISEYKKWDNCNWPASSPSPSESTLCPSLISHWFGCHSGSKECNDVISRWLPFLFKWRKS